MTTDKLQNYFRQQGYSATTIEEHVRAINEFNLWCEAENVPPEEAGYNDLTAYITRMQQRNAQISSINLRINSIRHYMRFLIKQQLREDNPAFHLQVKGQQKKIITNLLSETELDHLYKLYADHEPYSIKDEKVKQRNIVLLGLMICQGLITTDLRTLLATDINLDMGMISLAGTKTTNARLLKPEARQMFPLVQFISNQKGERLFSGNLNNISFLLMGKLSKLARREITAQQIRASRIVLWLRQYNIRQAQYYSGMKYLSSMERYRQQEIESLREELEKFHPLG